MTTKNEWIDLDPAEYAHLDAVKVKAFRHEGRDHFLLIAKPVWNVYSVLHQDEDGFSGLEPIDASEDFEEAQAIADEMIAELLASQE